MRAPRSRDARPSSRGGSSARIWPLRIRKTPVSCRQFGPAAADAVTAENGGAEPRQPDARMRQREQRTLFEPELPVERLVGIADARRDRRAPYCSNQRVGLFRRRHVHERDLRSRRLDGRTVARDVGQRFAAEGSAEVAEEDQQHGPVGLHRAQRLRQRAVPAGEGICADDCQFSVSSYQFKGPLSATPATVL